MPVKSNPRLEKWFITYAPFKPYLCLSGLIYDDNRFKDGSHIVTSKLVALIPDRKVAMTKNTTYQLGMPVAVSCDDLHGSLDCSGKEPVKQ